MVSGSARRLARAVGNLLDNAVKWGPPGQPVEVAVAAARSPCAITAPGSPRRICRTCSIASTAPRRLAGCPDPGLGLAIVKHVADAHGGSVVAEAAAGGGARLRLTLPLSPTS